jgi:hypothetical protein
MLNLNRRKLLLGGASLGAGWLIYLQADLHSGSLQEKLLRLVGGTTRLRNPEMTGVIDEQLMDDFWLLFNRTGERWRLWGSVNLSHTEFERIINAKTTQQPSYLTEYREAGQLLQDISPEWRTGGPAIDQLFRIPANVYEFNKTRLGRAQRYVIEEFITLLVTYGGFRSFGFTTYRGYTGGPLHARARLPLA